MDGVFRVLGSLWNTFWSWDIKYILCGAIIIIVVMCILDKD